jgi:hypothetical protein
MGPNNGHQESIERNSQRASGPESSFSLTRQAQTNHYDRRMVARTRSALALALSSRQLFPLTVKFRK